MKNLNVINKNNPVPAEGYFDLPVLDENGQNIINENNEVESRRFVINGKPLSPASSDTLGGIKVGNHLSIDENGVLSVNVNVSNDSSDIISIPVIVSSDIGIINQTFQFQVSARSATNATITQFKCNLTNCDEQIVNAQDNEANVTFTIPDGEDNDTLTFTCVAYDSNNNSSAVASKTITVKKVGIVVPNVTVNTENNYVSERPTITVTNTFAVYGNEGTTFSDTLDHIVYTVKENDTIIWTKNSTDYSITLDSDLLENKEYTFEAQFIGSQLSSPVGSIVKSTPPAFYIIDTPTVTLNATDRGLPEELIITSSQYKCRTFANALTTNETHSSTTWTLFEDDVQVWQSANDETNLTSITCGYALKTSKTYRASVVYNGSRGHSSSAGDAIGTTPDVFAIVNPTTVSVDYNANNDYYCGLDLVAHTAEFSAIGDTHASTDWKICSDENGENILTSVLDSSDLTSHTFNAALMSTIGSGTVYVFARHKGTLSGYSADWSSVSITLKQPTLSVPAITSPATGSEQAQTDNMIVSWDAATGIGANTTISYTVKICATNDSSATAVKSTSTTNTSATFSATDLADISVDTTYYIFVQASWTYGTSDWSAVCNIIVINLVPQVMATLGITQTSDLPGYVTGTTLRATKSGRLAYRHSNGKGTVLVFDRFGITECVFFADAEYRSRTNKNMEPDGTNISTLPDIDPAPYYFYNETDSNGVPKFVDGSSANVICAAIASIGPITDAEIQSRFSQLNVETTAQDQCTKWLATGSPTAILYARGLTNIFSGGLNVPLAYQGIVGYIEGDTIDALDPTVASFPNNALGKYGSNSNRWFNGQRVWACSERSNNGALFVRDIGCLDSGNKNSSYSVLPVYELGYFYNNTFYSSISDVQEAKTYAVDNGILASSDFASDFNSVDDLPGYANDGSLMQSEHGRLLYRHSNGCGSVIVFDRFGTTTKMFVADAQYRRVLQFSSSTAKVNLTTYSTHDYDGVRGSIYSYSDDRTQPLTYTYTDAQLQSTFSDFSTEKTARLNCDQWMTLSSDTAYAVPYCRSLNFSEISDGCDVANCIESYVIYLEADNLDILDPSASSYSALMIGYQNPNGRLSCSYGGNNATGIWTSMQGMNDNQTRYIVYNSLLWGTGDRNNWLTVSPIREL